MNAVEVTWSVGVSTVLVALIQAVYNVWKKDKDETRLEQHKAELQKEVVAFKNSFDKELERLKETLTLSRFVHDKQLEARAKLVEILDSVDGSDALEAATILEEPEQYDLTADAEAIKIRDITFKISDWFRIYRLFLSNRDQLQVELNELVELVKGISFIAQTQGPPLGQNQLEPLARSFRTLIDKLMAQVDSQLLDQYQSIFDGKGI